MAVKRVMPRVFFSITYFWGVNFPLPLVIYGWFGLNSSSDICNDITRKNPLRWVQNWKIKIRWLVTHVYNSYCIREFVLKKIWSYFRADVWLWVCDVIMDFKNSFVWLLLLFRNIKKPHVYVSVVEILIRNNDYFQFMIQTKPGWVAWNWNY